MVCWVAKQQFPLPWWFVYFVLYFFPSFWLRAAILLWHRKRNEQEWIKDYEGKNISISRRNKNSKRNASSMQSSAKWDSLGFMIHSNALAVVPCRHKFGFHQIKTLCAFMNIIASNINHTISMRYIHKWQKNQHLLAMIRDSWPGRLQFHVRQSVRQRTSLPEVAVGSSWRTS